MPNHWSADGDLVIEDRTLFRQVGWQGHNDGCFYAIHNVERCKQENRGGYSPVYEQIAVDHGEGWDD